MISRREYLRIIGNAAVVSAVAPHYGFGQGRKASGRPFDASGILAEACSFADKGGWKLDTQFYQQMGGIYLLAHGMGEPVANAKTTIDVPEAGIHYLHVRTKNWCPGSWEAPGRFNVIVNGTLVDTVFGTQTGWGWQPGGKVALKKGANRIELQDLTGFDGRVDGLYFSKAKSPSLPSRPADVMSWKDEVTGRSKQKVVEKRYDLVVVGGGMSGCAAALAAAQEGLRVALLQDRPVFGGNASDEVRVHSLGIHGHGGDIISKIDTAHYPNGDDKAKIDQARREKNMAASDVDLFPNTIGIGLSKRGGQIMSIDGRNTTTGIITRFNARQFIDCTGDGWLGFWAGAEIRYGRESHKDHDEGWEHYGELWSPEAADNRVMGSSVLWFSSAADQPSKFPAVPWAKDVALDHEAVKGEWYWEYSRNDLHQIHDAEEIRDHVFRAIYGSFANAKKNPKNARRKLDWVAYVAGRRESRRIMGDYLYTMKDMKAFTQHDDAVVLEKRPADGHYQLVETGSPYTFLSKAMHYRHDTRDHKEWRAHKHYNSNYSIPFRSLYSKDLANLMMAGRCFSCTHVGLSGPRVMNTCAQMGIATGLAAALCIKHDKQPRDVGKEHIRELRALCGFAG